MQNKKFKAKPDPKIVLPRIIKFSEMEHKLNVLDSGINMNSVYESAFEKLNVEDKYRLKTIMENIPNIKNFGDASKLELLCKIGLFLSDREEL